MCKTSRQFGGPATPGYSVADDPLLLLAMKRFYTAVTVAPSDDDWSVTLDGKPVRTPARAVLTVPNHALATAIAGEWTAQDDRLRPETMPLTGFAYAAIDRISPDVSEFADGLAAFAATELLAYRAEGPAALVAAQAAGWDPLLVWARARYDVAFTVTSGIVHVAQPPATLAQITAAFRAFDALALAALHPVVTICGSAVIGLAVAERYLAADAAFAAGQLDELWQAEQWGSDPLAAASLANRRAALGDAVRLLDLL